MFFNLQIYRATKGDRASYQLLSYNSRALHPHSVLPIENENLAIVKDQIR